MVWMRTAGLPSFRKLWAKVDNGLQKGKYKIRIANNYNVLDFEGKKHFVFATTNMFGGQNYFLAYSYLGVGAFCLLFALIFAVACCREQ